MEFSRQEYWSGLLFPSLGDLPDPGIKPRSPALQMDYLPAYSLYSVLFFHITWHLLHYFSCLSYIFFIVHLLPLECKLHLYWIADTSQESGTLSRAWWAFHKDRICWENKQCELLLCVRCWTKPVEVSLFQRWLCCDSTLKEPIV